MSQHPARRTRPQQIHMVDMGTTHQHRRHHRQHLTTRVRSTHPAPHPHRPIHQILQTQPINQRPRHQQTRVGYQPLIIENHPIPVDIVRYSTHRKCLQTPGQSPLLSMAIVPDQRHFPRLSTHQPPTFHRWIQAKCWGYNFAGQSWAPGGVFSDVSVGDYHSCGLRSDGSVTCWGRNEQGQSVDPTGGFAAVAAGGSHSCGLRSDGSATCWGRNDHGQSDAPSGVFAAIAAGGNNSCGLRATGAVVCWGDSGNGRLDVPTGRFTAVSVGHVSICGLRSDGRDSCWGNAERDVHRPRLPLGLDKPSDRPITSYFGPRMNPVLDHFVNHDGIDFGALRGEPVLAAGDGVVAFAGHWTGYGETVIVDHGGGVTTIYAHLASIQVSEGDEVLGGDRVGIVGCSGYCTVPHLHFEVRTVGIPVDPEPYLTGAPAGGPDR